MNRGDRREEIVREQEDGRLLVATLGEACPPFWAALLSTSAPSLSRRLVKRGVRFIQVYSGGAHNDDNWDAHGALEKNHNHHAAATDKPIAGLLQDLKDRGLLDETLVIWGGEFGRQSIAEYTKGSRSRHSSPAKWLGRDKKKLDTNPSHAR